MNSDYEKLVAFARYCIGEYQLDIDGIQDMAVECGLIAPHEVTEPCGDECACAECGFPTICYRMTEILKCKP